MIKLLYESYAVQNQLYTKNFKRKILLNMVIQIEKPIDKRVNLRELLSANLCQLTFETMPQFCLQLYLVFNSKINTKIAAQNHLIETWRLIISFSGVLVACLLSSVYASFMLSEIKPHIEINRTKFRKITFICLRFISNLFFISSRFVSIVVALTVSKIAVLIIVLIHLFLSFFIFYKYSLKKMESFYIKLNYQEPNDLNLAARWGQYFLFSTMKMFVFFEDIGSNIYCYLYHFIVWSEMLLMTCLFYFLSVNDFFNIYIFIFVINGFLVGFLIESFIKKLTFSDNDSIILDNLEAYFLHLDAFVINTQYEKLQNDSIVYRV